ncbi:MAG: prepilin-type N-terminal cleavage/methylation domain-containing protein [Planctomycetota bacterium]
MKISSIKRSRPRRGGFTLIELVMVIMILAIVAGLAVPIVGWLRRSANYAAQANTAAAMGSNLEFFRTTYGNNGYPDNLDSLILDDLSDVIPTTDESGYLDHGFDFLVKGNLTTDQADCFNWLDTIYDHYAVADAFDGLQGSPSNSGFDPRAFDGQNVAIAAEPGTTVATAVDKEQGLMLAEIYPNGVPSDVRLVAFGIGPSNEAIGRTIQSNPIDPRVDPSEVYGRYVAIFACYDGRQGRRAQLKAVLNAFGRTQNNAISEFWGSVTPE